MSPSRQPQHTSAGVAFLSVPAEAGIIAGIKITRGAPPLAGHEREKVTEGLDGLRERPDRVRVHGCQVREVAGRPRSWSILGQGQCHQEGRRLLNQHRQRRPRRPRVSRQRGLPPRRGDQEPPQRPTRHRPPPPMRLVCPPR